MCSNELSIFEQVKSSGIEYGNHESDLYIPVNEQTQAIIQTYQFKENVQTFRNQIDGQLWFDVPFAYIPFWEARQKQ
jgi:hypothetical protein